MKKLQLFLALSCLMIIGTQIAAKGISLYEYPARLMSQGPMVPTFPSKHSHYTYVWLRLVYSLRPQVIMPLAAQVAIQKYLQSRSFTIQFEEKQQA